MKRFLFFISFSFILSSCIKNNPDPVWLEVHEWTLESNSELSTLEGELTHNFTEAWVFVDDKIVGVFELKTMEFQQQKRFIRLLFRMK